MTDERAAFGLQFGHGLGVGLYESPMISRLHSFDAPVELEVGMVFALETYCPATDGRSAARIEEEVVVTPDRAAGAHALPGGRAARHRQDVRAWGRPARRHRRARCRSDPCRQFALGRGRPDTVITITIVDAERLRRIQIESRSDIMQRAEGRGSLPIGEDWIPRPYEGVDA